MLLAGCLLTVKPDDSGFGRRQINPGKHLRGRVGLIAVLGIGESNELMKVVGQPGRFVRQEDEAVLYSCGLGAGCTRSKAINPNMIRSCGESLRTGTTEMASQRSGERRKVCAAHCNDKSINARNGARAAIQMPGISARSPSMRSIISWSAVRTLALASRPNRNGISEVRNTPSANMCGVTTSTSTPALASLGEPEREIAGRLVEN
jgi:hypothetical protein